MNGFDLQLRAALVGDYDKEVQGGAAIVGVAKVMALFDFAEEFQAKWRADVQQSGLARAGLLANTVRLKRYKNNGKRPAALVYSSFPVIQAAFEASITITAKSGKYLLVPNPDVWPGGRLRRPRGGGGQSFSFETAVRRFGELHFIRRPGKASLLVAEVRASSTTSGFRKASATARRTGKGLMSIIVFFLVRKARTPKLLHGATLRDRARRDAPTRIQALFNRRLDELTNQRQLAGPSTAGRFFMDDAGAVQFAAPSGISVSSGFGGFTG